MLPYYNAICSFHETPSYCTQNHSKQDISSQAMYSSSVCDIE